MKIKTNYYFLFQLTWADFVFAGMIEYLKTMMRIPDLEQQYPSFTEVVKAVHSLPRVQDYLAQAPESGP